MAITIESAPEALSSMHDDLWHVASSTNSNTAGFKYVFDVYISTNLVARVKLFPDPDSGYGIFNAANIVRAYRAAYFKPVALTGTQTVFNYDTDDIFVTYEIKFGEEYGGTTYTNLTNASYTVYNYVNPLTRDWSVGYLTNYNNKYLTTRDKSNILVRTDERCYIGYFLQTPPAGITVSVSVDGGGTLTGASNTSSKFTLLDISPAAINTYIGANTITANTSKYTVSVSTGDSVTCYLACAPFETETLHFLNSLGGYDTMVFRAVNRDIYNAERETYTQRDWNLVSNAMQRYDSNNLMAGNVVNYATRRDVVLDLKTDWLSETDHNWLRDLVMSSEVYVERDKFHYPATIETADWTQRYRRVDKSFQMNLRVKFGRRTYSQFR
jgi:hypothetical protein